MKPRNHVIVAQLKRQTGAGSHKKNEKQQRMQHKKMLQKILKDISSSPQKQDPSGPVSFYSNPHSFILFDLVC